MNAFRTTLCVGAVLVFALAAFAQEEILIFRSGTTLVEFSMIVLDDSGNPVTDLRDDEIEIRDKGERREPAFFRFEGRSDEPAPAPLPPGAFTNRAELLPGPPRNITAIVLDSLNTQPLDQLWVRAQALQYLKTIPADTRIAIYGLGEELVVLHDFTDDAASLVDRLERTKARPQSLTTVDINALAAEAEELLASLGGGDGAKRFLQFQLEGQMIYNSSVQERLTRKTLDSLEDLGNHLSGIPGRKNLVWIGGGISSLSMTSRKTKSYESLIRDTAQRLAHQGVAMYVVDARGLFVDEQNRAESTAQVQPGRDRRTFAQEQQAAQLSNDPTRAGYQLADLTGGRVFRNTNDSTEGVKAVAADLRGAYSVGFYAADAPDGKWHRLNVKVNRKGVKVLQSKGYLAEAAETQPQDWSAEQWSSAIASPLGSTAIRLDAQGSLLDGESKTVSITLNILQDSVLFRPIEGLQGAELDIARVSKTAAGQFAVAQERLAVRLPAGLQVPRLPIRYEQTWQVPSDTVIVRLIVRDRFTGLFGTLDLPLKNMPPK